MIGDRLQCLEMTIHFGVISLTADKSDWVEAAHIGFSPLSGKFAVTALAISSPQSARKAAKAHAIRRILGLQ